jgi:tellurite methyltransferase
MQLDEINNFFGEMDIFLMDLILKGKVLPNSRVLDAGCGGGRQVIGLLNAGFDVAAIDTSISEVNSCNLIGQSLRGSPIAQQATVSNLPFEAATFGLVVCSRVLHFSQDEIQFKKAFAELVRVTRPDGLLYITLNTRIGLDKFPDNAGNYLPDFKKLKQTIVFHQLLNEEQIRTVLFDQFIAETCLVLRKPALPANT